jgi:APA family basic amino acid/polyamine antiporter
MRPDPGSPAPAAGAGGGSDRLARALGLRHATALVVGTIVGASIFVQPSEIVVRVPSTAGVVAVWAVAGLLTLCGALVCAELASQYPESGGVYAFLRESFSPGLGFLWGWAMFWTMHTGIIAAIAVVFARYATFFVPLGDAGQKGLAAACVLALSAVNYRGVRHGGALQAWFTAVKVLAILLMIGVGFALGPAEAGGGAGAVAASAAPGAVSGRGFLLALVAGLFAFGGWHMVTYSAEETVDARRTIPRALLIGTLVVTACYILLNAVYLYVLPLERVAASTRVAADAADAVLGSGGGALMSGLVVFSTFGALNGIILAGPRAYYAMARDGLLFRWVGVVHERYRTPHRAILLQAAWAAVLIFTGTYRALFTRVVYTEWIFFGLMALGLMRLRRRPGPERLYSVWGYPYVPAAFALAAFAIVVNQVLAEPGASLLGLGMVLVGWPVYAVWARRGLQPGNGRS